ncbi:hypothetical protein APHAL10511_002766 [Amanita phalloides]|nr:hypothetical protein APHAL10511_002766 [Amanita phalloides]
MSPPELPGFYWDQLRNRYFPLSSRPASLRPPYVHDTHVPKHRHHPWRSFQTLRLSHDVTQRLRMTEEILSSHYARTSHVRHTYIPASGRIRAFCTTNFNGAHRRFIGDDQGWLYTYTAPDVEEQVLVTELWVPELCLHPGSEITSICISGSKCIATCLGPTTRVSMQDLNVIGRTSLLGLKGVHDIWCAHLDGNSLAVGADLRAVYLHDLDITTHLTYLPTHSDVFSVYYRENLVYTGARNGSITRFDLRLKPRGQLLYDERFGARARSTVLHLDIVKDYQLLTSQLDGDLASYDLRFTRGSSPLVRYEGHVNTHSRKLGVAVDPHRQFLFAAGEDRRIRGWSLSMGVPITPHILDPVESSDDVQNPFSAVFPHPVQAMQVVKERTGLCLWAASDEDLYQYHLGQLVDSSPAARPVQATMKYITSNQLAKIIKSDQKPNKDYLVVDVRDDDFAGGNIKNAINIPSTDFEKRVNELVESASDVPLVVFHCLLSQRRGPEAARIYEETRGKAKEQEVVVLRGGFSVFQSKFKDDAELVEEYDKRVWHVYNFCSIAMLHSHQPGRATSSPLTVNYISSQQLADIIKSDHKPNKDYLVVDVRDDDYAGGNIKDAVNMPSTNFLNTVDGLVESAKHIPLIVFHCTYSQMRGPKSATIYEETRQNLGENSDQRVVVLRDGFTLFQSKFKDDPDLVENWDKDVWKDAWF